VLVGVLLIPVGKAIKSGLFDRHLVYLVPPDRAPTQPIELSDAVAPGAEAGAPRVVEDPSTGPHALRGSGSADARARALGAAELTDARPSRTETALTEIEVDSTVVRDPTSAAPEYPPLLLAAGVAGEVIARYVVDTLGTVDTLTYTVIESSRQEFVEAVRRALPGMRFRPAMQQGRLVRQWVEQVFHFRIQRKPPT
jgi:TonB family protein